MKSIFEKELAREQEIRAQYDAAEAAKDEAGMEAARVAHRQLMESIRAMGNEHIRIFGLCQDSLEKGNDLIDLNDCIWDEKVPALIETLRACGIDRFTFSSGWSSAVRTAWLFLQNGCTNEGMTLIHTGHYPFGSETEEMAPAYIFAIR